MAPIGGKLIRGKMGRKGLPFQVPPPFPRTEIERTLNIERTKGSEAAAGWLILQAWASKNESAAKQWGHPE
jgi:hypothetical protein